MKKFNKSVAWLLVVLMLALTACGGGGDTGSGTQAAGGSTEGTSVIIGQSS